MKSVLGFARNLVVSEDGPTAVDYAVMLALVVAVCIGAITTLGTDSKNTNATAGSAVKSGS